MDDETDPAQALIESAMSDVKIVACPMCQGRGRHPEGLDVRCPGCGGRGDRVEVRR